jgi:hypothetical protein
MKFSTQPYTGRIDYLSSLYPIPLQCLSFLNLPIVYFHLSLLMHNRCKRTIFCEDDVRAHDSSMRRKSHCSKALTWTRAKQSDYSKVNEKHLKSTMENMHD